MSKFTIISSCEAARSVLVTGKTYEDKAIRLARSIRIIDRDVPIVMWYGKDRPPSADTVISLEALNCRLVEGECLFPDRPLYNKVEALISSPVDTPYRLWVDTDIYVLGGLDYFYGIDDDVGAAADSRSGHALTHLDDLPIWNKLYAMAGISPELHRLAYASIDGGSGNFHCNSGVVWMINDQKILDEYKALALKTMASGIQYSEQYYDAIAIILLVLKLGLSFDTIPESHNYFYALRQNINGWLIHYQDNILDGYPTILWDNQ